MTQVKLFTEPITDSLHWMGLGWDSSNFVNVVFNQNLFLPLRQTLVLVMVQQLYHSFLNNCKVYVARTVLPSAERQASAVTLCARSEATL